MADPAPPGVNAYNMDVGLNPTARRPWTSEGVRPDAGRDAEPEPEAGDPSRGAMPLPSRAPPTPLGVMNHVAATHTLLPDTLAFEVEVPPRTALARPPSGFGRRDWAPFGSSTRSAAAREKKARYSDKLLSQHTSESAGRSAQRSRLRLATEALATKGRMLYSDVGLPPPPMSSAGFYAEFDLSSGGGRPMTADATFAGGQMPSVWGGAGVASSRTSPAQSRATSPPHGRAPTPAEAGPRAASSHRPPSSHHRPPSSHHRAPSGASSFRPTSSAMASLAGERAPTPGAAVYVDGDFNPAPVTVSIGVQVAPTGYTRFFFNDEQMQRGVAKRVTASQGDERGTTVGVMAGKPGAKAAAGPWLFMHFDVRIPQPAELADGIVGDIRMEPFGGEDKKVRVLHTIFDPVDENVQRLWDRLHFASLECHLGMSPGAGGWPSAPGGTRSQAVLAHPGVPLCGVDESAEAAKHILAVARYACQVQPRGREDAHALIRLQAGLLSVFCGALEQADAIATQMRDSALGDAARAFEELDALKSLHEQTLKDHAKAIADLNAAHESAMRALQKKMDELVARLRAEIDMLKRRLAHAEAMLKQEKAMREMDKAKYESELAEERDKVKLLEQEVDRLRELLMQLRAQLRELQQQLAEAGLKAESIDDLLARLKAQLELEQTRRKNARRNVDNVVRMLEEVKEELVRVIADNGKLLRMMAKNDSVSGNVEESVLGLVNDLHRSVAVIEEILARQYKREEEIRDLEAKYDMAVGMKKGATDRLYAEIEKEVAVRAALEEAYASILQEKSQLDLQFGEQVTRVTSIKEDFTRDANTSAGKQNDQMMLEIDRIVDEITKTKTVCENPDAVLEITNEMLKRLREELEAAYKENERLLSEIGELQEKNKAFERMVSGDGTVDLADILKELDEERRRRIEAERKLQHLEELEAEVESLRAQLDALRRELMKSESRCRDLERENQELREALERERAKWLEGIDEDALERLRKEYEDTLRKLREELEMLRKQLADRDAGMVSRSEYDALLEEMRRLKAELDDERKKRMDADRENKRLLELLAQNGVADAGPPPPNVDAAVQCVPQVGVGSVHDLFRKVAKGQEMEESLANAAARVQSYWTDALGGAREETKPVPVVVWESSFVDDDDPDAEPKPKLTCVYGLAKKRGRPVELTDPAAAPAHFKATEGVATVSVGVHDGQDVACLPIFVPKEPGSAENYVWGVLSTQLESTVKRTYNFTDSVDGGEPITKLSKWERAHETPVMDALRSIAAHFGSSIGNVDKIVEESMKSAEGRKEAHIKDDIQASKLQEAKPKEKAPDPSTGGEVLLGRKKGKIPGYVNWKAAMENMQFHQVLESTAVIREMRTNIAKTFANSPCMNRAFNEMKMYRTTSPVAVALNTALFIFIYPDDESIYSVMPVEGEDPDLTDDVGPPHGMPGTKQMVDELWNMVRIYMKKLGGSPAKKLAELMGQVKTPEECEDKRHKALMERAFNTSINLSAHFSDEEIAFASMALKSVKKFLETMWSLDSALRELKVKSKEKWSKNELVLSRMVDDLDADKLEAAINRSKEEGKGRAKAATETAAMKKEARSKSVFKRTANARKMF